jgi:hypothetical protein
MKKLLLVLLLLISPIMIGAQNATSSNHFTWDQPAPDLATANSYTYKYYPDALAGVTFSGVVCSGAATPFSCTVLIPAFTPGSHSIQLTASNLAGESAKSVSFPFIFIVSPGTPANIRIN